MAANVQPTAGPNNRRHPNNPKDSKMSYNQCPKKLSLLGTNISPKHGILKMIFLFPRWDMLIPWRVACSLIKRQNFTLWRYLPRCRGWEIWFLFAIPAGKNPGNSCDSNRTGFVKTCFFYQTPRWLETNYQRFGGDLTGHFCAAKQNQKITLRALDVPWRKLGSMGYFTYLYMVDSLGWNKPMILTIDPIFLHVTSKYLFAF